MVCSLARWGSLNICILRVCGVTPCAVLCVSPNAPTGGGVGIVVSVVCVNQNICGVCGESKIKTGYGAKSTCPPWAVDIAVGPASYNLVTWLISGVPGKNKC